MGQPLAEAVQAYRAAEDTLRRIESDRVTARAAVELAREALVEAIAEALRSGMRQVDVARMTGYSRERIRQIARAAGIP